MAVDGVRKIRPSAGRTVQDDDYRPFPLSRFSTCLVAAGQQLTGPRLSNPFLLATWCATSLPGLPWRRTRKELVKTSPVTWGTEATTITRTTGRGSLFPSDAPRHTFFTMAHHRQRMQPGSPPGGAACAHGELRMRSPT